ncbi:MAG TPA: class I SAM-dependent methyltransferase [Candidatus Acidoferrales bacterium]|nr:class I SAM-dependent methyltransferase [Candidatus Acidoferrales bacterium]
MFHDISDAMLKRMNYLEEIDRKDRHDGTPKNQRLRQIPPETGRFISLMAANCPTGEFIEIGTSAGYSTMWLSLAAKERNTKIKTFEILPEKARLARETIKTAGIENYVELIEGDFLNEEKKIDDIAFCFLDAEKEIYERCFDLVLPKLIKNGFIVADNAISHYEMIRPMIDKAEKDPGLDCLLVPIGKGEFVCRKK